MNPVTMTTLDSATLQSLTEAPKTPFQLATEEGSLECLDVLRFLPGKRLVLRARFGGEVVIAKCFFGSMANRDMKRELRGIEGFVRAEVPTPELIGSSANQHFHLVLTRELSPVISFDTFWSGQLSDDERRTWLEKISGIIGALHNVGVQQKDIHLDNLLLQDDEIYLIDGGGAEVVNNALPPKEAVENLALFQAVLFPRYDRFIENVWNAYCEAAPELADGTSLESFSLLVQQQRKWRERFVQKALRNCTQFRVEKSWTHFLSVERSLDTPALLEVLADPEQAMAAGKVIKQGRTNTLVVVELSNGEKVLIKRFKSTKGFLHQSLRMLRASRARGCWLNGFLLQMLGVRTPQPYAMLEKRFGPLTTCSYIINSYQPAPNAYDWFAQSPLPDGYHPVANEIGNILTTLQRSLVYHGDLKGNNFLVQDGSASLIDLDSMTSYKNPSKFKRANQQDINRFARNWTDLPLAAEVFSPIINKLKNDRD
ncbi:lipopolysaccharide kinase InaA family protein [Parendozoicomonas haliclonae]|uniref:3-deoxy-D-manno-octulosonic-acid kinase n=1 Tax=Parendozoicomonas haliclonae TaxID=1960125 RepID=A0A1X7AIU5_9GAMM|nr:lipopolysaccharide kinase InaA family protein [Parendozoicomonas haliclonae]SMA45777.1 3-deoxy-D-manno-octulosonic-acid kinase [Parendozoicomonas haliclonae]